MAQLALGIMRSGKKLSVSVINRSYRQKDLKLSRTFTLSADPENQTETVNEVVAVLEQISRDEKLKKARVGFGIGFQDFLWNVVEMPPVSRDDIRQILQFELDSHLPLATDDCIFDAQIIESTPGMNNRVVLIGVDKSVLESCQETSARADVGLDAITPAIGAIINTARSNRSATGNPEIEILLCAEGDEFTVVVTRDGRFLTGRTVVMENPWKPEASGNEDTEPSIDDLATTIYKNIQLALLACNRSGTLEDIERITCVGKFSDEVLQNLSRRQPAIAIDSFHLDGFFDGSTPFAEVAATCIALQMFEEAEDTINLLPPGLRPVRRDAGKMLISAAA
nr:hypothetical protein [bacterium]